MRKVLERLALDRRVYVYSTGLAVRERFVHDLEVARFALGNGAKALSRMFDEVMAVYPDMTVSFVSLAGRLRYGNRDREQWRYTCRTPANDAVARVDYARFLSGAEAFLI